MKGIIFREFLELVESKFGVEVVDEIIETSQLESKGAYTRVGTYNHNEFFSLLTNLSQRINAPVKELVLLYAEHLFQVFISNYGNFFKNITDGFEMLASVENTIHVEVLKLYPDAELPTFVILQHTKTELILKYSSPRKMGDFAEGLIHCCMHHFGHNYAIEREDLSASGDVVKFLIIKYE